MKLGENEKIVISLMNQYKITNEKTLQMLFSYATKRKARIDTIIHSLKVKGILDQSARKINQSAMKKFSIPEIQISDEIIKNIKSFEDIIKIGSMGKSIMYVLFKTEQCSLQFLGVFFQKPIKNIYAILSRLEQRNFVFSYNTRIRHVNSSGRRYSPKFYSLTESGNLWTSVHLGEIKDKTSLDELLSKTQNQIQSFSSDF